MQVRFAEIGGVKRKKEVDELVAEKEVFGLNAEGEPEEDFDEKEEKKKEKASLAGRLEEKAKIEDGIMNKEENAIFVRTQNEEEEAMAEIYPNLKRVLADSKYVAKSAVKMFRTRANINEQEFEEILELCEDKVEQQALREAFEEKKNRERYLHNADEKRQMLYDFINSTFFVQFMLMTIIVSIVGIFLLTFESISIRYVFPLQIMDACIIGIFVVEAMFKIMIYRESYFQKLWNVLDIVIIVVHFLEVFVELITKTLALSADINENIIFKFLKSLRALRLLRIIKFLPNLQVIVTTVFHSVLSLGSIAVLMCLFIFVFAVLGRGLFFESSPKHFGNLGYALVTLFQLLTLDDWFELLEFKGSNENDDDTRIQYWIMFGYLFCYMVIEYFVFLNLFVAVLVDNFQLTLADAEIRKQKEALIYLEGREKYQDMNKLYQGDETGAEGGTEEAFLHSSEYVNQDHLELKVEDYFPVGKGSRENALLEHIFKDLNSIDFERYLWKRRLSLLQVIMDRAIEGRPHRWRVQDADRLSDSTKEKLESFYHYEVS
jgi:cation channel sperm-associated protein 1